MACVILGSAYRLLVRSINDLMDAALPEAEQRAIEEVIHRHRFVVDHRDLRTRRSGSQRHVDFTIVACRHLPLGEAHDLVDHIEQEIAATIPGAHVVVHAEPTAECAESGRCVRQAPSCGPPGPSARILAGQPAPARGRARRRSAIAGRAPGVAKLVPAHAP